MKTHTPVEHEVVLALALKFMERTAKRSCMAKASGMGGVLADIYIDTEETAAAIAAIVGERRHFGDEPIS